jgi:hypothetical protein
MRLFRLSVLLIALILGLAAADSGQRMIPLDQPAAAKQIKPSDEAQVTTAFKGQGAKRALLVTCKAGAPGYPGISITNGDSWDLSAFGHVEAKVKNVGEQAIDLAVRVDNPGDWKLSPWNTEHAGIKPGETRTIRVCFGYSFGQPAYALEPKRASQVLLFVTSAVVEQAFQLEALVAGGKPGEKP